MWPHDISVQQLLAGSVHGKAVAEDLLTEGTWRGPDGRGHVMEGRLYLIFGGFELFSDSSDSSGRQGESAAADVRRLQRRHVQVGAGHRRHPRLHLSVRDGPGTLGAGTSPGPFQSPWHGVNV